MFSGIVEGMARIVSRDAGHFLLEGKFVAEGLHEGQSIAHDGACMTVTHCKCIKGDVWSYGFFAMQESLAKTTLADRQVGDAVNIERCMRYGDRIDGHLVTGHVDVVGVVRTVSVHDDGSWTVQVGVPLADIGLLVPKGCVAINGVSLTVVDVDVMVQEVVFSVCLIPYTLEHTNLGCVEVGMSVNVEFDMMAKYVTNAKG